MSVYPGIYVQHDTSIACIVVDLGNCDRLSAPLQSIESVWSGVQKDDWGYRDVVWGTDSRWSKEAVIPFAAASGDTIAMQSFVKFDRLLLYSPAWYHRLRGSASPVLTATGLVNGKWQFSTLHRIDTPQPITRKFVTADYVGDPYGYAKLGAYPSTGGFWAHGWNITKIIFIYTPYRSDTSTDFHTWWLKRRGLAQGCAFFWEFFTLLPI